MQATDSGKSRFSQAISEIEALARGLEKGARLTVIAFDRQPRVVLRDSNNYSEIKRALAELKPSPFSAAAGPALSLARALAREQDQPRILLLSDGGLTGLTEGKNDLELKMVGSRQAANVCRRGNGDLPAAGCRGPGLAGKIAMVLWFQEKRATPFLMRIFIRTCVPSGKE